MKKKLLSSTGLIAAFAFLLVINLISGLVFKSAKLDLTENQLYTLSKGTENILADLSEPITLRLYFSEKYFTGIPGVLNYGGRVKDLLDEYVSLSHGQLSLVITDPEPFSETEDEAVKYGLQGVPVDASGNQAYFGLVGINANEKNEVISFFQPDKEASLEYDVTRLIYSLAHSKRTVVGLMSSLPMEGVNANPFMQQPASQKKSWFILNQIKQSFDVKTIAQNVDVVPEDVDVLMLVHPKALSEKTLLAIDQFVLAGGRLLAFVDPFSEVDQPPNDPSNPMAALQAKRSSELTPLFDAWGVELVKDKIATDKKNAQRVQVRSAGRIKAVDYVAWMSVGKDTINSSDFITRDLEKVKFATPGYFIKKPDSALTIIPLISTSNEAMATESTSFQFGANPEQLLRKYVPGGSRLSLAVRVSGDAKTAFPNGVVNKESEEPEGKDAKKPKVAASPPKILTGSVNVVLVADTDFLEDKQWVQIQNFFGNQIASPHASNNVFVINALENLGGSNDLISLRSRSKSSREFTKVFEIKTEAEKRFRDQERALQTKLEETERKLAQIQQKKGSASGAILTQEQQQEIEEFRSEQLQTRKALRNVQHELVKSIESLGSTLKVINIGLMPFLVILFAIGFNFIKRKRLDG